MPDQDAILDALRTVKDPELNINVVDLGLVYTIQTHDDQIDVEMTLTTPVLPGGLRDPGRNARSALETVAGAGKANVKLVMSPPGHPTESDDAARSGRSLGTHF